MDLRLTVVDDVRDRPLDLLANVPTGATLADLAARLPVTDPDQTGWYASSFAVSPRALVGAPPLLHGVCLARRPSAGSAPSNPVGTVLELHVVDGPDCGMVLPLRPGRLTLGRSGNCDVQIDDPSLSRVHAHLTVDHDGVRLLDRGTTNGTLVAGESLDARSATLIRVGQRVRLGATTVVLRPPRVRPAAIEPDGQGHLGVNRGPRDSPHSRGARLTRPTAPEAPERARMPLLTLVLPLALSLVLAYVMDSAVMLLFGLMGPVMMLGSHLSDRRGGRLRHRRLRVRHAEELARFEADLDEALEHERRVRHRGAPDLAEVLVQARGPGDRLWHRRLCDDDFLRLRLGCADLPAWTTVTDAAGAEAHPMLEDVPVEVSLPEVGVLGVAGPAEATTGCLRGLVGQVAAWHSPRDVQVVVLADDPDRGADWSWLTWLPHAQRAGGATGFAAAGGTGQLARRVAELGALIDDRLAATGPGQRATAPRPVVVVVDGSRRLREEPGVARLLQEGPTVAIYAVCADTEVARLPAETGALLDLTGPRPTGTFRTADDPGVACTPALARWGWAQRLARHLCPLRDATPEESTARPPDTARLVELLDDATDEGRLRDRWLARPRSTAFTLGQGADGPEVVDLRRDGPHVLIGGTTGAGKSELLQTMIASLALVNRPDEMVFVLVDYKGGSAFKDCARLPHTVGLVTDLDGHLTARALRSLEAELRRRERVFGRLGAKDLEDYQRAAPPDADRVPRLVLVIDEFKMLAEDLPEFLDGLVKIAAVGRSLGVHLVLATQRPGGIVSSDIKANVNLRIALRVRDQADSDDVLDDPSAASISGRTPGRAMLRTGAGPLRLFQTARVGGRAPRDEDTAVSVRPLTLMGAGTTNETASEDDPDAPTDLCHVVDAVRTATEVVGVPPVASPWLPPLADAVALPRHTDSAGWTIPYAVADFPDEQRQDVLAFDLEHDGHLAFAGTARSGRTTVLRTLAASLATRRSASQVHLHVFDGSGGLRAVGRLPHTGVLVGRDEPARGARLLQRLLEEMSRRQAQWAEHGYSSLAEQHEGADGGGGLPLPYLVVVIDDWDTFTETYDGVEAGRPVEAMHQLLREGPSVGLRVVVTGGRSVLLSRTASLIPHRFCLRMADDNDLMMAGLPRSAVPEHQPPGRAVRVSDGVELQVAVLPDLGTDAPVDGAGRTQVRLLHDVARRCRDAEARTPTPDDLRPLRVEAMPRVITLPEVVGTGADARDPKRRSLVLGVGGDDLHPVTLDAAAGLSFLAAGPAGSGRTTALEVIARQLVDLGRTVVVVAEQDSPLGLLTDCAAARLVQPHDAESLQAAIRERADLVAVVDDVERLAGGPVDDLLTDLAHNSRRTGAGVVCAGLSHELLTQFRGLAVEVRRAQTGILLQPSSPGDGELFTVRAIPLKERFAGRGLHVDRGRLTPIQVALPDAGPTR